MFDPSYNKTATGFSTRIQPYSSPSSIHEKNGRNTGISHATHSPQGKALSLKPSLPISSILLSVPVGEISHRPRVEKRGADRQRDCAWRDNSRFVTSHSAASSRDTLDTVESRVGNGPFTRSICLRRSGRRHSSANGSPCRRTNEPWKNGRHFWPTNVNFIRGKRIFAVLGLLERTALVGRVWWWNSSEDLWVIFVHVYHFHFPFKLLFNKVF